MDGWMNDIDGGDNDIDTDTDTNMDNTTRLVDNTDGDE